MALLAGCSSDDGGSDPYAIPDRSSCIAVQAADKLTYSGAGSFFGDHLSAAIDVELEGGGYDRLAIRLRDTDEADIAPGTFTLGEGADRDYTTCNHCVMVLENVWGDNVNLFNFQMTGTMTLDEVNQGTGESRGSVREVIMKPSVQTEQHHVWTGFQDTDHCIYLAEASWDTFAGVGDPCASSGDCVNHKTQVCDPRTGACAPSQCSRDEPTCPGGDVCQVQSGGYGTGACFPPCTPFTSGQCEASEECVSVAYDGSVGVCKAPGAAAIGEECESGTQTTGCLPGAVCQAPSPFWGAQFCRTACDFFGGAAGCAADEVCQLKLYRDKDFGSYCFSDGSGARCHQGGTCLPVADDDRDPAAIGAFCGEYANIPCGVEGGVARGVCDADSENRCMRLCRLGADDCASGTCDQYYNRDDGDTAVAGIGVCR